MTLLEVSDLTVEFPSRRRGSAPLLAVDRVNFTIKEGETLGLVGESGSGKSTTGNAILGLVPVSSGKVVFHGREIQDLTSRARRGLSRDMQVVFQDPYSSLNPVRTVGQSLSEPVLVHGRESRAATRDRVGRILSKVGLDASAMNRYPAEFSGGQRQRIAIARALIMNPKLVICDEAVSALDLSVQAQILNLIRELQSDTGVSYLFISHDLDVVRHVSHRICVMHHGVVEEAGPAQQIYEAPQAAYTRELLSAAPYPDPAEQRRRRLARRQGRQDELHSHREVSRQVPPLAEAIAHD